VPKGTGGPILTKNGGLAFAEIVILARGQGSDAKRVIEFRLGSRGHLVLKLIRSGTILFLTWRSPALSPAASLFTTVSLQLYCWPPIVSVRLPCLTEHILLP